VSMETSVPRQRDPSQSALVDMLMREAPVGLALFGPDLRFRWVNAALARIFGRPEADYAGKLPTGLWPEDVAARAEIALRKVLGDGTPVQEAGYPAAEAGASADASWFPLHDAAGAIAGVGLVLLDGAGRAGEEEIRRSEERYRSLVQGGAQVVWVAAPDGAMKEDSPEFRWITGQSAEEYIGHGWLASIHPEDRERVERDWRECVRTGKVFDDRYRIRTKGGMNKNKEKK